MYLVIKHGFDRLENRNPEYSDIIGYIDTEDETVVDKWIQEEMKNTKQYRGWDNNMYPYFTYQRVENLS